MSFASTTKVAVSVSSLPAVVCRNVYAPAAVGIQIFTPSPFPETNGSPFTVTETSAFASVTPFQRAE